MTWPEAVAKLGESVAIAVAAWAFFKFLRSAL